MSYSHIAQSHRRHRPGAPTLRAGALLALHSSDDERHDDDFTAAPRALEVVQAELVEHVQETMPEDLVSAVLDAFLDEDGRLVPARQAELSGLQLTDPRRFERAQMLDQLRASAFADSTLTNYGAGVRAWRAWCEKEGVPALPFDPLNVANHLIDYAFVWDEEAEEICRDEDGKAVGAVVVGTIDMRLASLNKAAEFIGLPKPGDNEGVRELMRGLRRTFLTATRYQKRALTHDLLLRCLAATTGRTLAAQRTRTAVLTRARTDITAGQLEKLSWADVALSSEGVRLTLVPAHRYGKARDVFVPNHPTNTDLCLATVLRDLRDISPARGRLFTHASGRPLTRQALHLAVDKASAPAGGWTLLPQLTDRRLAAILRVGAPATPLQQERDSSLLLTGFWGALRRSNLSALNWADLVDHGEDGIEVILRRSKTDQEGNGDSVWAPASDPTSDVPCPAAALRAWKTRVTQALGREPLASEPVFMVLSGGGTIKLTPGGRLKRLSGDGINVIVQGLTIAAGIAEPPKPGERNPYGAHSLRAGFVTQAAMAGMDVTDIMGVTKHKSAQMVMRYIRMARAAKQNGSRRLLGHLMSA